MRIDRRDLQLLSTIADYRVMTMRQIVAIEDRGPKGTHRRLGDLAEAGLVAQNDRITRSGRGRPEKLFSIAREGVSAIRNTGVLRQDVMEEEVTLAGLPQIEHQLLLNWVRIHWMRIERLHAALRARFVPHSSPMMHPGGSDSGVDAKPVPVFVRSEGQDVFIPDAVATIADVERGKTVLFFVEIDMGTEPFDAPRKSRATIVHKHQKYHRYFQAHRYRDYESVWNCALRGFRVLFVTNTKTRFLLLGDRFQHICPRDFIWITYETLLQERGIGASIWARGGQHDRPPQSILGSRACGVSPDMGADIQPSPRAGAAGQHAECLPTSGRAEP